LLVSACNSGKTGEQELKALTLEELVAQAPEMNDMNVSVEGLVTHVCKHGGQKMFLTDSAKNIDVLVRVSNSIPEFEVALEGSKVKVTGKIVVSLAEEVAEESHMEEHMENVEAGTVPEDCPTEEAMKEGKEEGAADITYYIEATEYAEIK
jgi:hypothetical protein